MPRRSTAEPSGDNHAPHDALQLQAFADNILHGMTSCLEIEDRSTGRPRPFSPNPAQLELDDLWENIRSLNVARNAQAVLRKAIAAARVSPLQKVDLEAKIGAGFEDRLGLLQRAIKASGTTKVMRWGRELGMEFLDGPVRIDIVKPRQIGCSTYIQGRAFMMAQTSEFFRANIISHQDKSAANILEKTRTFQRRWSSRFANLRQHTVTDSKDHVKWGNDSEIFIETAASRDSSRSFTYRFVHCSELAHFGEHQSALAALRGTMPVNCTWVQESTAKGKAGAFYHDWRGALAFETVLQAYEDGDMEVLQKWNAMFRFFFPWYRDPDYSLEISPREEAHIRATLDMEERSLLREHRAITTGNLAFRRLRIKTDQAPVGMSPEAYYKQEFPTTADEAFQGKSNQVFNPLRLDEMEERSLRAPAISRIILVNDWSPIRAVSGNQNLVLWQEPQPGHHYCIGADVAQGLAHGDWSVASILDRCDGTRALEVGLWRGHVPPKDFGDILTILGEWFNLAFMMPEANNQGQSTCVRLIENGYFNIYRRRVLDSLSNNTASSFTFGWMQTSRTKPVLIGELQRGIDAKTFEARSKIGINELREFALEDGQFGAPAGGHDDYVLAAALGYYGAMIAAPPVPLDLAPSTEELLAKVDFSPRERAFQEAVRAKIQKDRRRNEKRAKRQHHAG